MPTATLSMCPEKLNQQTIEMPSKSAWRVAFTFSAKHHRPICCYCLKNIGKEATIKEAIIKLNPAGAQA